MHRCLAVNPGPFLCATNRDARRSVKCDIPPLMQQNQFSFRKSRHVSHHFNNFKVPLPYQNLLLTCMKVPAILWSVIPCRCTNRRYARIIGSRRGSPCIRTNTLMAVSGKREVCVLAKTAGHVEAP